LVSVSAIGVIRGHGNQRLSSIANWVGSQPELNDICLLSLTQGGSSVQSGEHESRRQACYTAVKDTQCKQSSTVLVALACVGSTSGPVGYQHGGHACPLTGARSAPVAIHAHACPKRQRANRTSLQEHTARGGLGRLLRLHVEGEVRLLGSTISGSGAC
jgi:hypothetical protein